MTLGSLDFKIFSQKTFQIIILCWQVADPPGHRHGKSEQRLI